MTTKKYILLIATFLTVGVLSLSATALAVENQQRGGAGLGKEMKNNQSGDMVGRGLRINDDKMTPNVVGKVLAKNGNMLTVVSKQGFYNKDGSAKTTTFTVDTTNAKILRGQTAITIADVAIGDNVVVQGTITGTNVVATIVRDGKVGEGNDDKDGNNQAMLQIQGNGQPVVAGTVSAISGSTITITNSGTATYTVDATNAKILQGKNTITISGIKVGDSIMVQGTVNGTFIAASTIIDQVKLAAKAGIGQKPKMGIFGSVGQFFRRLFGF